MVKVHIDSFFQVLLMRMSTTDAEILTLTDRKGENFSLFWPEKLCIPDNPFAGFAVFTNKINTKLFFNFNNLKLMTLKKILTLNFLRIIALIVVLAGAFGSLGFVLYTGRKNESVFLNVLFVTWVLSPFAALLIDSKISTLWSVQKRTTLYFLMLVLSIGSLVAYSGAAMPARRHSRSPSIICSAQDPRRANDLYH